MEFKRIQLSNWQQFNSVNLAIHARMTILTGANGTGKTTILNLLARHHDWPMTSLATPRQRTKGGRFEFITRWLRRESAVEADKVGEIEYSNGKATLRVPATTSLSYQVQIEAQQAVPCFFVPSHRAIYRYEPLSQIPVTRYQPQQAFQTIWNVGRERYFGSGGHSASFHMKEMLIAWSIFGRGNEDMAPEPELYRHYQGFQEVLRRVLPDDLGFARLSIRNMEVVVECKTNDFLIDAASGGLSALIDLAWQVFMFSTTQRGKFTVVIDEIENHLHPTMQRRVLPDFAAAFPAASFIVSTHAPLVVNSVRESIVHVLRRDSDGLVVSEQLDFTNRAKSANDILAEVLGVGFSMPAWAENELRRIVAASARSESPDRFKRLRAELHEIGLEDWMPVALSRIVEEGEER